MRFVGKSAQPNCALFRILFDVCSEFLEDAANSINRSFIVATEPRNLKGQSLPALSIQTDKRRLFCRPAPLTGGYSTEGAISLRRLNFILEQNIPSCFYKEGTVQNAMCINKTKYASEIKITLFINTHIKRFVLYLLHRCMMLDFDPKLELCFRGYGTLCSCVIRFGNGVQLN